MPAEYLEVAMMLSFGAAWPASILKSCRSRTAKGKSLGFLLIVVFGYLCGIMAKVVSGHLNYVVLFYLLNCGAVSLDIAVYFRNRRLDKLEMNGRSQP
jgi:hypothetical protein